MGINFTVDINEWAIHDKCICSLGSIRFVVKCLKTVSEFLGNVLNVIPFRSEISRIFYTGDPLAPYHPKFRTELAFQAKISAFQLK